MSGRRQVVTGLILLAGGLVVIAIGTIFPSNDALVALGWLMFIPLLVSMCGAALVFVGLARSTSAVTRSAVVGRIVVMSAVAGLCLALGYGAAGLLSQVPDSLAGLNGPFIPGAAQGLSAFLVGGVGLAGGLVIGAGIALAWWIVERRGRA